VAGALYGAGYRSSSQLYTQAPACLGMTPTTYRKGGIGMDITYTTINSPLMLSERADGRTTLNCS